MRPYDAKKDDDTTPIFEESKLPTVPDVARQREKWDIVSFDLRKGDVLALHPGCLHGGAPVDADFPNREAMGLRYFGDDCYISGSIDDAKIFFPRGFTEGEHYSKSTSPSSGFSEY